MVAVALPGLDFIQYLAWYLVYTRTPLEVIAEGMGFELETPIFPDPRPTRHSPGHDSLVQMLEKAGRAEGSFEKYGREMALRVAEYLRRADCLGPALEAQDLDDLEALLGTRPETGLQGDAALEDFVMHADPDADGELVRILHRRMLRQEWLIDPVMRELRGVRMQRID